MLKVNSVVNKILESSDIHKVLNEAGGVVDQKSFYLAGDLYGIEKVLVVNADGDEIEYSPRKGKIFVDSGDIVKLESKFRDVLWDYFAVEGSLYNIGEGKICQFIVLAGANVGVLKIGYFEDPNDGVLKSHKIDLENSDGWCKWISEKSFKVK